MITHFKISATVSPLYVNSTVSFKRKKDKEQIEKKEN